MRSATLIAELKRCGARLEVFGDRLRVQAPKGAIRSELKAALEEHKRELLVLLGSSDQRAGLLAWASELGEQDIVLERPTSFVEKPRVPVQVQEVSKYARRHLRTIASAHIYEVSGGWGHFDATWWHQRKQEALDALVALREALNRSVRGVKISDD